MKRAAAVLFAIAMAFMMLSGCASSGMSGEHHIEMVQGKPITYVVVRSGSSVFDHASVIDRYAPDGQLLAHDVIGNNGVLESLGGAAMSSVVPVASFMGPIF